MNPLLMEDTFVEICYHITTLKMLMLIEEVSKWHKNIIRKNKWLHLSVQIYNNKNIILSWRHIILAI